MFQVEYTNERIDHLVAIRPNLQNLSKGYTLFVTISPNPKVKVRHSFIDPIKRRKVNVAVPYKMLPIGEQYEYCMTILKRSYFPFLINPILIGTYELNKQGNTHFHFLLKDDAIQNDYQLTDFRKQIGLTFDSIKNKIGQIDYMNNIVRLTKPIKEVIEYMDKVDINSKINNLYNYYIDGAIPQND